MTLDVSPAILIPFYDEDNNTVFLRWVDIYRVSKKKLGSQK